MTERAQELLSAAATINAASLEQAAAAVAGACWELSRWAGLFESRLDSLAPAEEHKFARALSLTMLGQLPARPATCPFCIQYGQNRACTGCGYAATHGRCDDDASAFSIFIEAFQELGRVIYQDMEGRPMQRDEAISALRRSIHAAQERAGRMEADVGELGRRGGQEPGAGTMRLMDLKRRYLGEMVGLLPFGLLSTEVEAQARRVQAALERYW